MALHGEEGGEMLNLTIAKIERRTAGIRKESEKMACIMKTSASQTEPKITRLKLQPRKKKKLYNYSASIL